MKRIVRSLCVILLAICLSLSLVSSAYAVEEPHEHSFGAWEYDELNHWKSCKCGQITEIGKHDMVWKSSSSRIKSLLGLEKGVCSVCGISIRHAGERLRPLLRNRKFLLLVILFLLLLVFIITIVAVNLVHNFKSYLRHLRHHRQRRRHHRHHSHRESPAAK